MLRNMKNIISKYKWVVLGVVLVALIVGGIASNHNSHAKFSGGKVQVVAGENFWGSLASQIGGDKAKVTSTVSDPNADPHDYESTNSDARTYATANYVILNGAGYDSWGDKLLAASPNPDRKELNVANLLGKKEGDNPHFWYSPDYVNKVIVQMEADLASVDPADSSYFAANLKSLQSSLAGYQNRIASIKKQFGGTKVAATEDIFAYLANAAGLNLISPPDFIEAVAEGNDPPAQSIVEFENQLNNQEPKVLAYNQQTVTPLTTNMKILAAQNNIPVIGITEIIQPSDVSFQEWMNAQLISLENALKLQALGQ